MHDLFSKAQKIKCLILDVDGVLTDGKLYFSDQGEIVKAFYVQDGMGLKYIQRAGIQVAIITGRKSKIVADRAKELAIHHLYQGIDNKLSAFEELLPILSLSLEEFAYVGDDTPDLPVMQRVGLSITVPNAHPEVIKAAHWQTRAYGGNGAVREVCDMILLAQNKTV